MTLCGIVRDIISKVQDPCAESFLACPWPHQEIPFSILGTKASSPFLRASPPGMWDPQLPLFTFQPCIRHISTAFVLNPPPQGFCTCWVWWLQLMLAGCWMFTVHEPAKVHRWYLTGHISKCGNRCESLVEHLNYCFNMSLAFVMFTHALFLPPLGGPFGSPSLPKLRMKLARTSFSHHSLFQFPNLGSVL
jgi:hypothetical protein